MKLIFVVFILISNLCFSQANLKLGLRAYYSFSGNANDVSGNNNPVFNNATLTSDRFGNPKSAYHFNGKNNYMRIPNSPSLNANNKLSLCAWVRPIGFYGGKCHGNAVMMKGDADYLTGNYLLRFDDGAYTNYNNCSIGPVDVLHQSFYGGGASAAPPGYTTYIQSNQWYNVIITYDGTTAKLYVNCVLKVSLPQGGITFTNAYDLYLGKLNNGSFPYWFNGDMDEVRIYDRALSKEEILALCNEKPEPKKPEYVEVKPKKKQEIVKPGIVKEPIPLVTTNDPTDVVSGFIKLSTFENEKEVLLQERKKEMTKEITVDSDSISITLYDNGEIDGDSITLIYNDKILTTHQLLTDKPLTFVIKVTRDTGSRNELVMYAENLGSIPPNTALMIIQDGDKRYELNVNSTKSSNGAVSFKLRE